jgi:hypothetical protein
MADAALVINIDEDTYNDIKRGKVYSSTRDVPLESVLAIANGTPLDKIRLEIEQTAKDYDKFDDYRRVRGLWIALEIINKYRGRK